MLDTTTPDINNAVMLWFYRMFSVCKNCGTLLHLENSYQRDDTRSHFHTYCKSCYISIQKNRNGNTSVKLESPYYYLIKNKLVFFNNQDEKITYLKDRKTLSKFSKITEGYSSRVGCSQPYGVEQDPLFCDQCGGLLRCNNHGELECTECGLIADYPVMELERNINFDKQIYSKFNNRDPVWSYDSYHIDDENNDEGCFDIYYSRAMSKRTKL